jgi:hypothetical protein
MALGGPHKTVKRLAPSPPETAENQWLQRYFSFQPTDQPRNARCLALSEQIRLLCQTSEPDFAAIDFLAFSRVDLSGSMAAPSI